MSFLSTVGARAALLLGRSLSKSLRLATFRQAVESLTSEKGGTRHLGAIFVIDALSKAGGEVDLSAQGVDVLSSYVREFSHKTAPPGSWYCTSAAVASIGRLAVLGHPAELYYSSLKGCRGFQGGVFREADLVEADLMYANLEGADFEGARFVRARLLLASLTGAKLRRTKLSGADLRSIQGANTDFGESTGVEACFDNADLEGADFEATDLVWSSFREAKLQGANFKDALISGACFEAADLTQDQLDSAIGNDETVIPEGLRRPKGWDSEAVADRIS